MNIRALSYALSIALCLTATVKAQDAIPLTELLDYYADPIYMEDVALYGIERRSGYLSSFLVEGDESEDIEFGYDNENYYAVAYEISLAKGDKIDIRSIVLDYDDYDDVDTRLYIYKKTADGYVLSAENDDCAASDGYGSCLIYEAEEAGDYYIVVSTLFEDTEGEYRLEVSLPQPNPITIAQLLDKATPMALPYGQRPVYALDLVKGVGCIEGTFCEGSNYFAVAHKVTLAANDVIKIDTYYNDEYEDPFLLIYRKIGNDYSLVKSYDIDYYDSYEFNATNAGEYYIVLMEYFPEARASYYLTVRKNVLPITLKQLLDGANKSFTYSDELSRSVSGSMADLVDGIGFELEDISFEERFADVYKITLAQGDNFKIFLSKLYGDSYLYVFKKIDGVYSFVAKDDDDDSDDKYEGTQPDRGSYSYLNFTAAEAGDYYIVVTDYGSDRDGSYELKVWNTEDEPVKVIAKVVPTASFQAWTQNGTLHMNGLTAGKAWSVYSATGALVSQGIANDKSASVHLNAKGVYFVRSEKQTVRIINR
ncbi:MAG: PPC domain-containing protein [Fibromonadales bacterium]|nr:PPC domain-containing protein [Fibromonadales bacterium]